MNRKTNFLILLLLLLLAAPVSADVMRFYSNYTNQSDGYVYTYGSGVPRTFTALRNDAPTWYFRDITMGEVSLQSYNVTETDRYQYLKQNAFEFNTTSLGTYCTGSCTIDQVRFSVYMTSAGNQKTQNGATTYVIGGFTDATPGTVGDLYGHMPIKYSDENKTPTTGRQYWTFNAAGLSNVSTSGWTFVKITNWWDFYNDTTGLVWSPGENKTCLGIFYAKTGDPYMPELEVTFTPSAGSAAATFSSNKSATNQATAAIEFTDTSGIANPTSRIWAFKDLGGNLPEPCYSSSCTLPNGTKTRNAYFNFSWGNESVLTHTFGNGDFDIRLNVTNATGTWVTDPYYHIVNVTSNRSYSRQRPTGVTLFPSDTIFYADISNLSVSPQSAAFIQNIKNIHNNETTVIPSSIRFNISVFFWDAVTEFYVNSTVTKQLLLNNDTEPSATYRNDADFGLLKIPDDAASMYSGTDHSFHVIDTDANLLYEFQNGYKQANGTWNVLCAVYNLSGYYHRFSKFANGTLNGNNWGGNLYQHKDGTIRTERTPLFVASMSGIPISPFLVRQEELEAGEINHMMEAVLWKANGTSKFPALGSGYWGVFGSSPGSYGVPGTGEVFRLKSSVNLTQRGITTPYATTIGVGLKKHGAVVLENGCYYPICITGVNSSTWNSSTLADVNNIKKLTLDDFEIVNTTLLMIDRYSLQVPSSFPPIAAFTKNLGVIRIPKAFVGADTSTNSPTSRNWSFGDGTFAETSGVTHQYKRPGKYNVTLTVTNSHGTDSYTEYVRVVMGGFYELTSPESLLIDTELHGTVFILLIVVGAALIGILSRRRENAR